MGKFDEQTLAVVGEQFVATVFKPREEAFVEHVFGRESELEVDEVEGCCRFPEAGAEIGGCVAGQGCHDVRGTPGTAKSDAALGIDDSLACFRGWSSVVYAPEEVAVPVHAVGKQHGQVSFIPMKEGEIHCLMDGGEWRGRQRKELLVFRAIGIAVSVPVVVVTGAFEVDVVQGEGNTGELAFVGKLLEGGDEAFVDFIASDYI